MKMREEGNKIIAVSSYAGRPVKGYAKCHPSDKFDETSGRALAKARCNQKVAYKRNKCAFRKLKEARERLGMTQVEVAKRAGLSRQTYGNYESGKREPDIETLLRLSKVLGVTVDWLIQGDADLEESRRKYQSNAVEMMRMSLEDQIEKLKSLDDDKYDRPSIDTDCIVLPTSKTRSIPCFESASAGFGAYAQDKVIDTMHIYIDSDAEANNTICIKVKGDSMYPKIEDGDVIQVLKQDTAEDGDIVVILDGDDAYVKKFTHSKTGVILESLNPMYPPRKYTRSESNDLRIVGVVKCVIRRL